MKLLRYGPRGQEKTGMLDPDGQVRDLSAHLPDLGGEGVALENLDQLRPLNPKDLPVVAEPGRIGSCLSRVPNFFGIGLNYARHAAEAGFDTPKEPILFNKTTSALSGPNDPVTIPHGSTKCDWELELGVVIGRKALYVGVEDALRHVAGYCVVNDISERSFQMDRGGQWIKGKSAPGFGPTGPWLVTADEVPDPQNLTMSMRLNDQVMQSSSTSDMIFSVAEIISYMSQFMELQPGDLIATGTPEGVGMGQSPARYLTPGDVMELTVAGLGVQSQMVRAVS